MTRYSSAWMFADHDPDSFSHDGQALGLAVLRLFVLAVYKPFLKPSLKLLLRLVTR